MLFSTTAETSFHSVKFVKKNSLDKPSLITECMCLGDIKNLNIEIELHREPLLCLWSGGEELLHLRWVWFKCLSWYHDIKFGGLWYIHFCSKYQSSVVFEFNTLLELFKNQIE